MRPMMTGLLLILLLGACTPQMVRKAGNDDLFELEAAAEAAYRKGDYPAALADYERLVQAAPDNALLRFRLGNTCARLGRLDLAAVHYEKALTLDPDLARARYNLGVVRLRQARAEFLRLIESLPDTHPLRPLAETRNTRLRRLLEAAPSHAKSD